MLSMTKNRCCDVALAVAPSPNKVEVAVFSCCSDEGAILEITLMVGTPDFATNIYIEECMHPSQACANLIALKAMIVI